MLRSQFNRRPWMTPGYASVPGYGPFNLQSDRLDARSDRASDRSRVERRAMARIASAETPRNESSYRLPVPTCRTSVRDRLQIPANAESHRATRQGANSLHRLRDEVCRCCSAGLATIAFQACLIDRSSSLRLESTIYTSTSGNCPPASGRRRCSQDWYREASDHPG